LVDEFETRPFLNRRMTVGESVKQRITVGARGAGDT
jgi:hypothetical protein